MPESFHTRDSFNSALSIAEAALGLSSTQLNGKIDSPLLLLGLMYREVSRSIEVEPDNPTKLPPKLVNSPFGVKELREIEMLLNDVTILP